MFEFNNQITVATMRKKLVFHRESSNCPGALERSRFFIASLFTGVLWHNDDPPSFYFKVNSTG